MFIEFEWSGGGEVSKVAKLRLSFRGGRGGAGAFSSPRFFSYGNLWFYVVGIGVSSGRMESEF